MVVVRTHPFAIGVTHLITKVEIIVFYYVFEDKVRVTAIKLSLNHLVVLRLVPIGHLEDEEANGIATELSIFDGIVVDLSDERAGKVAVLTSFASADLVHDQVFQILDVPDGGKEVDLKVV